MQVPLSSEKIKKAKENLVYMHKIRVQFGNIVALDGVDFIVGKNEIIGLIGNNGAGKTTLVKSLIGIHPIATGEIYFDGKAIRFKSPREARLAGIETGYQDLALIENLSIIQNFFLGREIYRKIGPFKYLDSNNMYKITAQSLAEFGFNGKANLDRPISKLSGGERQAISIARAVYFGAKLLILDEPTVALSEDGIKNLLNLVRKVKYRGISVIFITHNANEVFQVADRFVVLHNGKNHADFKREDTNLQELEKFIIHSRLVTMKELSASVAHQVKNPLAVMKVAANMLQRNFKVEDKKEEYNRIVGMLNTEINTLNHVVNNFMSFARPLHHKTALCSVKDVMQSAIESLPLKNFAGNEIKVIIQKGTLKYTMDENLMEQAISNLVLNALEASEPDGKVEIRAFMLKDRLCIEVEDWGKGFDETTGKKIFLFFFTTKKNGAGLGLSLVHRIVEQHNGTIIAKSTPGKGTKFRIII